MGSSACVPRGQRCCWRAAVRASVAGRGAKPVEGDGKGALLATWTSIPAPPGAPITGFGRQPLPIFTPAERHRRDIDDSYVLSGGPDMFAGLNSGSGNGVLVLWLGCGQDIREGPLRVEDKLMRSTPGTHRSRGVGSAHLPAAAGTESASAADLLASMGRADQAGVVGGDDELGAVARIEFHEQAADVGLGGGEADVQLGCDLGVGQAEPD